MYPTKSKKYFWLRWPTVLLIQGQWWSMRSTHWSELESWCARSGL